jgi:uncharacterized protein (DUF2141 family)
LPLLAGALIALPAASPMASLDVGVTGLRSMKGQVLVCVTADPKHFPDCGKDPAARKLAVPTARAADLRFPDMPSGSYAVSLFHDENSNGKLDMRFGLIPLEGMGFSNNPRIRFGAPTFAAARFAVTNQPIGEMVRLQYFL